METPIDAQGPVDVTVRPAGWLLMTGPDSHHFVAGAEKPDWPHGNWQPLYTAQVCEQYRADAERYRIIKKWHYAYCFGGMPGGMSMHLLTQVKPKELDEAIDARARRPIPANGAPKPQGHNPVA